MGSQQFCLRWNNHQMNMLNVFDQLLHNGDFVDVTLSCTGGSIKAHKMVLSACSPYFQELFRDNPCKHPIVILKDMKMLELRSIVDFMYKGEINVSQDQLPTLLKTAESLKVKGLAEVSSSSSASGEAVTETVNPLQTETNNTNAPANVNGNATTSLNQRFSGESSTQSDGRMSPHSKRKRHRPSRRLSNDESNNEEQEDNNEAPKEATKSNLLKSEPMEMNEPQIELLMDDDQFQRLDTTINEPERHSTDNRDGSNRLSQSDLLEISQPSTSSAHPASGGPNAAPKLTYAANSGSVSSPTRSNFIPWVRTPCRSGPCKTWHEETMFTAVRAVLKMGVPLIHASRRYSIPYPTLFYYTSRVRHLLKPEDNNGEESSPSELQVSGSSSHTLSPYAHGSRFYHSGMNKMSRVTGRRGRPTKVYLGTWPDEDLTRAIIRVVYRDCLPKQLESIISSIGGVEGDASGVNWNNSATGSSSNSNRNEETFTSRDMFPPVECNFTESEDSGTSTKDVGTEMLMTETGLDESGSNELWPSESDLEAESVHCQGQTDVGTDTDIDLSVPL